MVRLLTRTAASSRTSSGPLAERPRLRRAVDWSIVVVLVTLAAAGGARWLDVTAQPVVVLQTAGPLVAIALLLLALATALLRRWLLLLPVLVVLAVAAAIAVPGFFAHRDAKASRDLTVMSANLMFGRADAQQVMDAVRAKGVDVLVLTEATPEALDRLNQRELATWFPHSVGGTRPSAFTGTLILSRTPLTSVGDAEGSFDDDHTPSLQPEATTAISGVTVRFKAAHPVAPLDGDTREWHAGLRALTAWRDRQEPRAPFVIAGDFNASHGHPVFRVLAAGLVDAQVEAGGGWVRTWPFVGRRVPPYVQLDHVLSSGLTLVDAGQVAVHGTDHALVWASYSVKAAQGEPSGPDVTRGG